MGVCAEVLLCCNEIEAIISKVSAKQMYCSGLLQWDGSGGGVTLHQMFYTNMGSLLSQGPN